MPVEINPTVIEDEVLSFVAERCQTDRGKLLAETRLAEDLGVRGDEAMRFLRKFSEVFKISPEGLRARWRRHFSPDGGKALFVIAAIAVCLAAGFRIGDALGILPGPGWALLLIVLFSILYRHWQRTHVKTPITIADLIDAARAGNWAPSRDPPQK